LSQLGPAATATSTTADLIDSVLASGTKSGYTFTLAAGATAGTTYTITAVPVTLGTTGQRAFFTNQSGVIRANTTGSAPAVTDPPI